MQRVNNNLQLLYVYMLRELLEEPHRGTSNVYPTHSKIYVNSLPTSAPCRLQTV